MDEHASDVCRSGHWLATGSGSRYGAGSENAEPIWTTKPETAGRVRGRIECVLDWAKVRGYREGENPARWRGHLDKLLPARSKVRQVEHHAAMPYTELPSFLTNLCEQEGIAA